MKTGGRLFFTVPDLATKRIGVLNLVDARSNLGGEGVPLDFAIESLGDSGKDFLTYGTLAPNSDSEVNRPFSFAAYAHCFTNQSEHEGFGMLIAPASGIDILNQHHGSALVDN